MGKFVTLKTELNELRQIDKRLVSYNVEMTIVNNSNETTTVSLPKEAELYLLAGEEKLRSRKMTLNGKALELGADDELPALEPVKVTGEVEIPATNCAFIVL